MPLRLGVSLLLLLGVILIPVAKADGIVDREGSQKPHANASELPQPPVSPRFSSLSEAAFFYLNLAHRERWRPIPQGPLLQLGDSHSQVPLLRRMLVLYGDLPSTSDTASVVFDRSLRHGLIHFQRRHGVVGDGVLGPKTRAALNIPPGQRAFQIALNLSRQNDFNGRQQSRYVQVNIPEYRLRYFEQGSEVLAMKAIIGRRSRQTPVLESKISSLVVNPSWNVPRGIAYRDILPRWKEDSDYLSKNNLKVVSGWSASWQEWPESQVDRSRLYRGEESLRFWQPPGADNALGQVKFVFPNPYAVYLHDTPERSLFQEAGLAFSSGCVRLEKPWDLAQSLVDSEDNDSRSSLHTLLEAKKTHRIQLRDPVPLYLTYWTAWLDEQQVLNFGEDIYRYDRLESNLKLL